MKTFAVALALGLAACGPGKTQVANDTQARPLLDLTGRIVDQAKVFDVPRAHAMEERLARLEQVTGDQVIVVSVPTLEGQPIDQFAKALGNRWGIGREDLDNGVVILVAPTERKIWVSVGLGLEGLLTNQRTHGIVQRMLPDFKRRDLPAGIERGVGEIEQALKADRRRPQRAIEPTRKAA